jgi:hypothetical protein
MAKKATPGDRLTPPYIPWETFTSFLARLKATTVPNRIDNSMMPSTMSGSTRAHLASALRFFGLVTEDGTTTDNFRLLVKIYDTPEWHDAGAQIICDRYDPILNGLELESTTPGELDERFEAAGLTGQMREKCVRFYLAAMASVGGIISPHLSQRRRRSSGQRNGQRRRRESRQAAAEEERQDSRAGNPPAGTISFPIYFKGKPQGTLIVPSDLASEDVKVVELLIPMLRAYAGVEVDQKKRDG